MANVEGTFYSATTQRRGVTPVSPPNAVDDPVEPVSPPIGSHPPVTIGTPANGLSIVPSSQVLSIGLASSGVTGALSGTDYTTILGTQSEFTVFARGSGSGVPSFQSLAVQHIPSLPLTKLDNITGPTVLGRLTGSGVVQSLSPSDARSAIGAIGGTGVAGQVAFFNGADSVTGDTGFLWNNTNKTLDIGSSGAQKLILRSTGASGNNYLEFINTGGRQGYFGYGAANNFLDIYNTVNGATRIWTNNLLRWSVLETGILQSNGAQTIQTSTGNLTLATAAGNGNIVLNPNGTGGIVLSKNVAIGAAIGGVTNLYISKNIEGGATSLGIFSDSIIQSSVTGVANYFRTLSRTVATAFTLPILVHYSANQGTFGAGSTVTTQHGFEVASTLIGATTNIGYYGNIPSGTNRWNIFMNGTALNYFNGNVLIGTTTDSGDKLRVNGTVRIDTINNLGTSATSVLVPSATGVVSSRTLAEFRGDLGATTLGANLFTIPNPSAITFPRFNADNTVSALSAGDFMTAIGAIGGTGVAGQVAFFNGTGSIAGDTGFTWDNANKRLGVLTNTPSAPIDVVRNTSGTALSSRAGVRVENQNAGGASGFFVVNNSGLTGGFQFTGSSYFTGANNVLSMFSPAGFDVIINANGDSASGGSEVVRIRAGGYLSTNDIATFSSSTFTLLDTKNIALGTTTGTKIGTANTQKLAFWNATPIVQPLETALANTPNSGDANTDALITALKNIILNTGLGRAS